MKKKPICVCPKCNSKALWYKPNGDVQCTCCMTVIKNEEEENEIRV